MRRGECGAVPGSGAVDDSDQLVPFFGAIHRIRRRRKVPLPTTRGKRRRGAGACADRLPDFWMGKMEGADRSIGESGSADCRRSDRRDVARKSAAQKTLEKRIAASGIVAIGA